jgi:lysyl endopeptidase
MNMNMTVSCPASSCAAAQPPVAAEHQSKRTIRTVRKTSLYAAIAAAVLVTPLVHAASPVTEMGGAYATEAPMAKSLGGALFATRELRGPTLIDLGQPSVADARALKQRREDQVRSGEPFEIGFGRNVPNARIALTNLGWERLGDGSHATRFEVSSDTAAAMRAELSLTANSRGNVGAVTLRFGGADGRVFERNGRDFVGRNAGWSPLMMGDTATVEIVLAKGQRPQNFALSLRQISHLDISPIASEAEQRAITKIGQSGDCNQDIACPTNPSDGFKNAERAVAKMLFTKDGKTFTCSGTLLNNLHKPVKNLFWTAAHCISTQTVADTLQTIWLYKAWQCGGSKPLDGSVQLDGGAFLRHADSTRDTALLELKKPAPNGTYRAGWQAAAIVDHSVIAYGIHHPSGDVKKYSRGTINGRDMTFKGKKPLLRVGWQLGTTEKGSSGSGLFIINTTDAQFRLVGGLYGGTASCTMKTNPDYYSQLSGVWDKVKTYFIP